MRRYSATARAEARHRETASHKRCRREQTKEFFCSNMIRIIVKDKF